MRHKRFFESIYTEFLVRYLLLAFVPMVLALGIAVNYTVRYDQNKYSENHSVTDSIRASILTNLDTIELTTRSLLSSRELTSFLGADFAVEADYDTYLSRIQTYMQATINANPQYSMRIYMSSAAIPMSMDVFYHLSDVENTEPIHAFLESDRIDRWLSAFDFGEGENVYLIPTDDQFLYLTAGSHDPGTGYVFFLR